MNELIALIYALYNGSNMLTKEMWYITNCVESLMYITFYRQKERKTSACDEYEIEEEDGHGRSCRSAYI